MDKEFITMLPHNFVKNTIALCGERGKIWLETLPQIIANLEDSWSITAGKHFRNLSFNYVATATLPDGEPAVLKIGLPLDDVEIFGEAKYLQTLDGQGAARLLQFDRKAQAALLERLQPGATLKSVCRKDQSRTVQVTIDILKRIIRPRPSDQSDFVQLDRWFSGLKRHAGTNFPEDYAVKALSFYEELSQDTKNIFLIHGDLHHDNILSAKREPFLVIDPKGIIGHIGYDIGVFLNNHHNWLEWNTRLEGKLDKAVADFASAINIGEMEIRKWAYCQMVLSWWWTFDEMPDTFGDAVGLSDIWKV